MAIIIQNITLDVSKANLFKSILAKQYDSGSRFLRATIEQDGNKIEIPKTSTVTINATRPDKTKKTFDGEVNDDGTVTVPLTYWMLELEGEIKSDVSVIDKEGRKLTTTNFSIEVERASSDGSNVTEEEEVNLLLSVVGKTNDLQEQIDTLNNGGLNLKDDVIEGQVNDWLDSHPDAMLRDDSVTLEKLADETKDFIRNGVINVKDFGAKGDGTTDDTKWIKEAVASLKDGDKLVFPQGYYKVYHDYHRSQQHDSNSQSVVKLNGKKNITIDLDGSTIELVGKYDENGNTIHSNAVGYRVFEFIDCENFTIKNGVIKGDRVTHNYEDLSSYTYEYGYGILVKSDKYNGNDPNLYPDDRQPTEKKCGGLISNMEIYDFTGDGVHIKNGLSPEKVTIRDCEIHRCRRQGITIADSDITVVNNCHIHHIGVECDGIKGTSPMVGIDVECGSGTYCTEKVIIKDSIIENTGGGGVVSKSKTLDGKVKTIVKEISITNCKTDTIQIDNYNAFGSIDKSKRTKPIVDNCNVTHQDKKHLGRNMGTLVVGGTIINCVFNSNGNEDENDNMFAYIDQSDTDSFTTLEHCVINSITNQRIAYIKTTDCIINGGTIKNANASTNTANWSYIGDCTNTLFNGSTIDITNDSGLSKYRGCSFVNCTGTGTPNDNSFKCFGCYFDTRLFKDGKNYRNCIFEDEEDNTEAMIEEISALVGGA